MSMNSHKIILFILLIYFLTLPVFAYLFNIDSEMDKAEKKEAQLIYGVTDKEDLEKRAKKAEDLSNLKNANQVDIKLLLTPFWNQSKTIMADKDLFKRLKKLFEENGYQVNDWELPKKICWQANLVNLWKSSDRYLGEVAKKNGYDYIVVGEIDKWEAKKDFRLGNFLVFPVGLGNILYGYLKFSIKIVSKEGKVVYQKKFSIKKKNQVGGFYQGKGAVIDRAFRSISYELTDEIKPILK